VQPVDLAHLAAQTGGDRALEAEVLRMFAARSLADLARLKASAPAARRDIAHLIVGSARAIGAGEVARLAAAIEAGEGDPHLLEVAIDEARTFIAEYLGS
jgi:HPt (histidine-containing phosphotransfer) domain-containing protein